MPNISTSLKQKLLSTSANALKICTSSYHGRRSFVEIHKINKRATLTDMCNYKHTLPLHKLFRQEFPKIHWVDLYFQQVFHNRIRKINFVRTKNYKAGLNLICYRLHIINIKIDYPQIGIYDLNLNLWQTILIQSTTRITLNIRLR